MLVNLQGIGGAAGAYRIGCGRTRTVLITQLGELLCAGRRPASAAAGRARNFSRFTAQPLHWARGNPTTGLLSEKRLGRLVDVSCAAEHVLLQRASGATLAWGDGSWGRLGMGDQCAVGAPRALTLPLRFMGH